MHREKRKKTSGTNSLSASGVMWTTYGSMRTIRKLERLKYLTDVVVSWMAEQGYSELSVQLYGCPIGAPAEYSVNLKSDLD